MARWVFAGLIGLALLAAGCGGDKDKNRYRESDPGRPKSGEKAAPGGTKG